MLLNDAFTLTSWTVFLHGPATPGVVTGLTVLGILLLDTTVLVGNCTFLVPRSEAGLWVVDRRFCVDGGFVLFTQHGGDLLLLL
jgi:hypothetical protein